MPSLTELDFRAAHGGQTQVDLLAIALESAPGEWFSMPSLASYIGGYAVHSRIADLRRRIAPAGGQIENMQRCCTVTGKRQSFYRYLPAVAVDGKTKP